jgi:hypothetical protein
MVERTLLSLEDSLLSSSREGTYYVVHRAQSRPETWHGPMAMLLNAETGLLAETAHAQRSLVSGRLAHASLLGASPASRQDAHPDALLCCCGRGPLSSRLTPLATSTRPHPRAVDYQYAYYMSMSTRRTRATLTAYCM